MVQTNINVPLQKSHSQLLTIAAATQNVDQAAALRLLLQQGASIHDWDDRGNTCLHVILTAAQPKQPWAVQSLIELIEAGADPAQMNHKGLSAFDIACHGDQNFGSFRRDILLQALLETGSDILDERLLDETCLTASYTSLQHSVICGNAFATAKLHIREILLAKFADASDYANTQCNHDLGEAAVDRVLLSYSDLDNIDSEEAFESALLYVERTIGVKKQVAFMVEERLPNEAWKEIDRVFDCSRAEIQALLEFDWFRPVDPEDVFLNYVDNLIQQLEYLKPFAEDGQWVNNLINILENAASGSPADQSKVLRSSAPYTGATSGISINTSWADSWANRAGLDGNEGCGLRKSSIAQTPIEFYLQYQPVSIASSEDSPY